VEAAVEQKNHVWEISIIVAAGEPEPEWSDPLLVSATHSAGTEGLLDLLRDLKAQCDTARLEVTHDAGDVFDYELTCGDGRVWRQQIRKAEPVVDAALSFDVPDFWTIREISTGRGPIIRKLIELLNAYAITEMEVVWL
jgi:hypothetical protein